MLPALTGLDNVAHFIVYDQRGSMRSPAVATKISVQKHVEDLDLLRQRLGLNRVTILAHSMGTFLAQSYLEAHPDHVKGVILAGAIAPLNDSLHSALGASNKIGGNLSTRPEVDSELKKVGLLNKTDLTDQEKPVRGVFDSRA
jgi:pimeloyl-ACP methyl ester carboxylesterase